MIASVDTATMNVPYAEARDAYRNYQQLVTSDKTSREDLMLYRAFRALVRGQKVIDLNLAMKQAGLHPQHGLPKLAIARTDWTTVRCWGRDSAWHFTSRRQPWSTKSGRASAGETVVRAIHTGIPARGLSNTSGQATVPYIPPPFRPKHALTNYHLLFEAEWERVPPVDPFLLQHLDGPFYVVLAVWNLTAVEQAVLRHKL